MLHRGTEISGKPGLLALLLVSICLFALVMPLPLAYAQEPTPRFEPVLLNPILPAGVASTAGEGIFYGPRDVSLPQRPAGCLVGLAGDITGTSPYFVDDRLTLLVRYIDGREGVVRLDFRQDGARIQPEPAGVLPALAGAASLVVTLEDLQPPSRSASGLWLAPCVNAAELPASAFVTKATTTTASDSDSLLALAVVSAVTMAVAAACAGVRYLLPDHLLFSDSPRQGTTAPMQSGRDALSIYDPVHHAQWSLGPPATGKAFAIVLRPFRVVELHDRSAAIELHTGLDGLVGRVDRTVEGAQLQIRQHGMPIQKLDSIRVLAALS